MKRPILVTGSAIGAGIILIAISVLLGTSIFNLVSDDVLVASAEEEVEPNPELGLIVTSVAKGGVAEEVGIVRGDILLSIHDKDVNNLKDLYKLMNEIESGDQVQLTILHGDEIRSFDITLGDDPLPYHLGLSLCCGTQPEKDMVVFELDQGKPLITYVLQDSPAENAGLKVGDLIRRLDGKKLGKQDDFAELIRSYEPGDTIELEIQRIETEKILTFSIELGEHPEEDGEPHLGVYYIKAPKILSLPLGDGSLDEFNFQFIPFKEHRFRFEDWFGEDHNRHFGPFIDEWILPHLKECLLSGVIISEILDGSPAAEAGLLEGDMIISLNGDVLHHPKDLTNRIASFEPGEEVLLTILREDLDNQMEITATLGEHPDKPGEGYLGIKIGMTIQMDHAEGRRRFDRWIPNFDHPPAPFHFEWHFELPGSQDA